MGVKKVPRSRRIKLEVNTSFLERGVAGKGAKYLKSGEISLRDGLEIAISCCFGPLGAVIDGASRAEVEQIGQRSRAQLETYINLALNRCEESETVSSPVQTQVLNGNGLKAKGVQSLETIESVTSRERELNSLAARVLAQDEEENNIDIENEVL